ncbi:MAG: cysteine desulfurase NifS [Spirochaetota bacterium]|nr:cysteine desulfurase NifS [Spirochaetota bacterium]
MNKKLYLDHAATTPCATEVTSAMIPYFEEVYANPSVSYSLGQRARRAVEGAREEIAESIGAEPDEIIFTSGGTEANNTALKGITNAYKDKGNHIIISSIEHHSILEPSKFLEKNGFTVSYIPVNGDGIIDPDDIKNAITEKTILISTMHANNEIGTIQPIKEIGGIAKERDIIFHTDAVQSFGHISVNVNVLNLDLLSASAHKVYGPKGVGILYIRKGTKINPLLHGGDQEKMRRASTENVPGIVGFGKAVELANQHLPNEIKRITKLRDRIIKEIQSKIEEVKLNGHPVQRLPNNINLSIKNIEGESMILNLDMSGIYASTGSACASQTIEPSHVLKAIGLSNELALSSFRLTLGRSTKEEDINYIIDVLQGTITQLRSLSHNYKKE